MYDTCQWTGNNAIIKTNFASVIKIANYSFIVNEKYLLTLLLKICAGRPKFQNCPLSQVRPLACSYSFAIKCVDLFGPWLPYVLFR